MAVKYDPNWEYAKNEEGLFICLEDNKTFKSYGSLENHLRKKYDLSFPSYLVKNKLLTKDDFVQCLECGQYCKSLNSHLRTHKMKKDEYVEKFNYTGKWVAKTTSKKLSELNVGENNSNHHTKVTQQERKERSPFSIEFYKKKYPNTSSEEQHFLLEKKIKESNENKLYTTQLEYWVDKCNGDIEEAKKKLKERQSTFSLEKIIEKHGEKEGLKIWKERQDKWQKSLLDGGNFKHGYSKVSQDLFNKIALRYTGLELEKVYYATNKGELRLVNVNARKPYMFDFTDEKQKKIIEYNGDMFHGNPNKYKAEDCPNYFKPETKAKDIWEADRQKKLVAEKHGYDVLYIWDSEFKKDEEGVLNKCLEFLGKK